MLSFDNYWLNTVDDTSAFWSRKASGSADEPIYATDRIEVRETLIEHLVINSDRIWLPAPFRRIKVF